MEAPARVRPVALPAEPSAQPPATLPAPAEAPPRPDGRQAKKDARRPIRRRRISPLTLRILLLNCLPLAILVGGLLYFDDYRRSLIEAELQALATQGRIIAAALGEAASDTSRRPDGAEERLSPELARQILRRLVEPTGTRARIFATSGPLLADSTLLGGAGGIVQVAPLPPPDTALSGPTALAYAAYDLVLNWFPYRDDVPAYRERAEQRADDYEEVQAALRGEIATAVRMLAGAHLALSVAVPVQRFKQVLGALMLSTDGAEIERTLRYVRLDILTVFAIALSATVLISIYLSSTIARPIRRLAHAALRVRRGGQGIGSGRLLGAPRERQPAIPDMSRRNDEIGDLSVALGEMTEALWQRLDAIERFAADVAHEIKNPLTSLRSAVETAARLKDPLQQRKLMAIILEDVARLDRLIGDISDASRLDAELSRAQTEPVDVARLLRALVELHRAAERPDLPRFELNLAVDGRLTVPGLEDRLGQVFRNLIDNAISFSPPGGKIRLAGARVGNSVEIAVEDEGPGLPDDKLEAVFERFYSERPKGEKFGTHSGLGLSISRQIVVAHGGTIRAANRRDSADNVLGARFTIRLPVE